MEEFEQVWEALVENGSSKKHREVTRRFWDSLSGEQQHQAAVIIPKKVAEGRFVHYDPIRALKENTKRTGLYGPTNYNGRALPSEPVVIAKWQGRWGTYTKADVELYGLETRDADASRT